MAIETDASTPIIATTISSSTSVKPAERLGREETKDTIEQPESSSAKEKEGCRSPSIPLCIVKPNRWLLNRRAAAAGGHLRFRRRDTGRVEEDRARRVGREPAVAGRADGHGNRRRIVVGLRRGAVAIVRAGRAGRRDRQKHVV